MIDRFGNIMQELFIQLLLTDAVHEMLYDFMSYFIAQSCVVLEDRLHGFRLEQLQNITHAFTTFIT